MKKVLLTLLTILTPILANADDNGSCGENVFYSYNENSHTLTISGTGNMNNYGFMSFTPWRLYETDIQTIIISSGVTSIGDSAFEGCSGLKSITIPDGLISIGMKAFYECSALTSIIIPNGVTSIESHTFYGCKGLNSITIPNSVVSIGGRAFEGCSSLTSITIPDGVTSIEDCAFYGCSSLTSFTIPDGITSIGVAVFSGCKSLISVTIPDGVTSIGESAFSGCGSLVSITIPESVSFIGDYAFHNCNGLTSISIPDGVTSIMGYTFQGCSGLTSISIPDGVTSIGGYAFYGCSGLSSITIPERVTFIGSRAFYGCSGLNSISIPDGVTSIEGETFFECSGLTSVSIPDGVTLIGNYAFFGCNSLTSIPIPDGVNNIGEGAFMSCRGLTSITIPEGVTSIEYRTFSGCSSLSILNLPGQLIKIGEGAFSYCNTIKSITIPESVEYIYQDAFKDCTGIDTIYAQPTTPPFIYNNTFSDYNVPLIVPSGCINIYKAHDIWKNFTNISDGQKYFLKYLVDQEEYKIIELEYGETIIPEEEPTKEGYTFSGWSEIPETMPAEDVIVTGTFIVNQYKLVYQVDGAEYKSYDVDYGTLITPEAEPTKEGYTFSGWSEIPETMPAEDVTITGTFTVNTYKLIYQVDGAEYKSYDVEYGATITPEAEPTKEGYIFSGWSEIPETMPANDVTITGTFTVNKYKLVYQVDGVEYKSYDVEYGATITPEAEPTKEGYTFSGWSLIPETMPAEDVTITGSFTKGAYKITYVVDGETYKTISYDYGDAITPEAEPTKEGYIFSGWSEIPETMPAEDIVVTGSFTKAVYEEEGLKLEITDGKVVVTGVIVQSEDLKIPVSVEIEGKTYAVIAIAEGAFTNCADITSVEIPDGVETIGANAFAGCINLNIIILGSGVTNIGSKAFANIGTAASRTRAEYKGLKVICNASTVPNAESDAFEGTNIADALLLVDDNLVTQYQTTAPWSGFGKIYGKEAYTGINDIRATESGARIYDLNGNRLTQPQRGVNIIRMGNGTTRKVMVK